jgi:hypothetical protein
LYGWERDVLPCYLEKLGPADGPANLMEGSMAPRSDATRWARLVMCVLALVLPAVLTGCQVEVGGQVLPSPYYLSDDVQYFPPGPEFKLAREATALREYAGQQAAFQP